MMNGLKEIGKQTQNLERFINIVPGTLVYRGSNKESFKIEMTLFNDTLYRTNTYDSSLVLERSTDFKEDQCIHWLNITGIANVEEIKTIGRLYDIDPLVLEQILTITKHGIYQKREDYVFNDLQMIRWQNDDFYYENIGIYMAGNCVITFQEREGDVFDSVRDRLEKDYGKIRDQEVTYTYFCLLDAIVDNYLHVLEQLKRRIEGLEERMIEGLNPKNQEMLTLKKHLMILRLSASPLDDLMEILTEEEGANWERYHSYFESLATNVRMVVNELTLQRETVDSIYEHYMMTNANDMNSVMTTLTIFSAIFIPLSFVAGVFGMNFNYIPGLDQSGGFFYFIGGCIATAFIMVGFFKWRKWF